MSNSNPKLLLPIGMLFVAMLLIANTIAVKIVAIGPFNIPAGILCFPITYIFGDILVEVYGYRQTRIVIWTGLFCQVLMAAFYYLSATLHPAVFWQGQDAWASFFTMSPRIVLGSLIGYFSGEFANAFVMSKMKLASNGRHLWQRTIGSTIVGEGVDTLLFSLVAFGGIFSGHQLGSVILSGYILKVSYEVIITPLTYVVVGWLKSYEQTDHFDTDVKSYNPFSLRHV
jgi:uncharacterized integral membrane protein (TIGR00697 family)